MRFLLRVLQRIGITAVALVVLWFIVTQIFERLDDQMPFFLALILTYVLSSYILLPLIVRLSVGILRIGNIPRFTRARDGLPADPVNMILIGSETQLLHAFKQAGWHTADDLGIRTSWKMIRTSITGMPYLTAPFSSRFLFGRVQDYGFQKPIGENPRKRHHIRFWAVDNDPVMDSSKVILWAGAGSEDTGIGFSQLTYQITHKIDGDVDRERDYILGELRRANVITEEQRFDSGGFKRGKYTSDGHIIVATLI